MKNLFFRPVDTPIGRLGIVCDNISIIRLLFAGHNPEQELPPEMRARLHTEPADGAAAEADLTEASLTEASLTAASRAVADRCADELRAYFAGKLREFTVPVSLAGTPFEQAVWAGLRKIPYGRTVSYTQLATLCGLRGARAVGHAVGCNPVPILVPCHRVIRQDGSLGGYLGGVDVKKKLLELEQAIR